MIDAKDLRIGNWITDAYYESFKTLIQVESINNKGINLEIEDDGNYPECASRWIAPEQKFENLFGIPLTPEILEKCGFTIISNPNHTNSFLCYTPMMKLVLVPERKTITLRDYSGVQNSITYLHELQNLYYALTKQELNYQP